MITPPTMMRLSEIQRELAAELGDGNMTRGVVRALDCFAARREERLARARAWANSTDEFEREAAAEIFKEYRQPNPGEQE
jgi:hypothetical protein